MYVIVITAFRQYILELQTVNKAKFVLSYQIIQCIRTIQQQFQVLSYPLIKGIEVIKVIIKFKPCFGQVFFFK